MKKNSLSQYQQHKLIELFVTGVTARTAAELTGVHRNTAACLLLSPFAFTDLSKQSASGNVWWWNRSWESYFGSRRKGKHGRGAAGKVPVFGLLKRNGNVYTVTVPNTQTVALLPIIREQVQLDSIVYTDCYRSKQIIARVGCFLVLQQG